eukprot:COSAG01_NODE_603_length_14905_cov_12.534648_18_plen_224_part_00
MKGVLIVVGLGGRVIVVEEIASARCPPPPRRVSGLVALIAAVAAVATAVATLPAALQPRPATAELLWRGLLRCSAAPPYRLRAGWRYATGLGAAVSLLAAFSQFCLQCTDPIAAGIQMLRRRLCLLLDPANRRGRDARVRGGASVPRPPSEQRSGAERAPGVVLAVLCLEHGLVRVVEPREGVAQDEAHRGCDASGDERRPELRGFELVADSLALLAAKQLSY